MTKQEAAVSKIQIGKKRKQTLWVKIAEWWIKGFSQNTNAHSDLLSIPVVVSGFSSDSSRCYVSGHLLCVPYFEFTS